MTNRTKQFFFVSLALAIVMIGGLMLFVYGVKNEGERLQEQIEILKINDAKESSYWRIKRLSEDTKEKQAALADYFFTAEEDSINFLGEMEDLARRSALELETIALEVEKDAKTEKEKIKIIFSFSGQKDRVFSFADILEDIPYHSVVKSLNLREEHTGHWTGEATILISINKI